MSHKRERGPDVGYSGQLFNRKRVARAAGLAALTVAGAGALYSAPYLPFVFSTEVHRMNQEKVVYGPRGEVIALGDSYMRALIESNQSLGNEVPQLFVEDLNNQGLDWQFKSYATVGTSSDELISQLNWAVFEGAFDKSSRDVEFWVNSGGNDVLKEIKQEFGRPEDFLALVNGGSPSREDVIRLNNAVARGAQHYGASLTQFLENVDNLHILYPNIKRVVVWYLPDLYNANTINMKHFDRTISTNATVDVSQNEGAKLLLRYVSNEINATTHESILSFNQQPRGITVTPFSYALTSEELGGLHPNPQGYAAILQAYENEVELSSRAGSARPPFKILPQLTSK